MNSTKKEAWESFKDVMHHFLLFLFTIPFQLQIGNKQCQIGNYHFQIGNYHFQIGKKTKFMINTLLT